MRGQDGEMINNSRIIIVNPSEDKRWDDFVAAHPDGKIFHLSGWKEVLESTYRYRPYYMAMEDPSNRSILGVFPLALVRSVLTGTRIVSLPFAAFCDPIIPIDAEEALMKKALNDHPEAGHILLKCENGYPGYDARMNIHHGYVTHILYLDGDEDQIISKFHNTSVRQRIRRADRNKLEFVLSDDRSGIDAFFNLHTKVRKKQGLPPIPKAFFINLWKIFRPKGMIEVPLVLQKGSVLASAIILRFNGTYHFEYSASDQKKLKICANQKLIWECIKIAMKDGAQKFDFGRSHITNKPLIEFKERWGSIEKELFYYTYPKDREVNMESGSVRSVLERINCHLPAFLLRLEGKLIYPHLG